MMAKRRGYRRLGRAPVGQLWERLAPDYARGQPRVISRTPALPSPGLRELIDRLAGYGFTVWEISRLAGVKVSVLHRHFRDELQTAILRKDLEVLESAFNISVGGPDRNFRHADPAMARFWLAERRGWGERDKGSKHRRELDLDRLSDGELDELARLVGIAGDEGGGEGGVGEA